MKKAIELYDLIGEYLPEDEEMPFLDFVGKIIDNTIEDESEAYADALCLMSGRSIEEIEEFSADFLVKLFADCLIINNITNLRKFLREIGYDRSKTNN